MEAIKRIGTFFVCLFLTIGGVAGTIFLSAAIIRAAVPEPVRVTESSPWYTTVVASAQRLRPQPGEDEARDARNDNDTIRNWGVGCGLAKITSNDYVDFIDPKDPVFPRVARIGRTLYDYRVSLAKSIDNTFTLFEWTAILGILIGLGTMIFAGIRGDDVVLSDGNWKRVVRILAVVFPALGTAVAAFAALYGPREELTRLSQSLTSLQQVHGEVLVGIEREPCPNDDDSRKKILKRLDDWDDRVSRNRPATIAAQIGARMKGSGLKPPE